VIGADSEFVAAGQLVGAYALVLAVYLGGIALVARLRDPLRGRVDRPLPRRESERAAGAVIDVRGEASSARIAAARRLRLQLAGLLVGSPVLVPFLWPNSVPYAVAGLSIGVGVPWWMRRRGGQPARTSVSGLVVERPLRAGAVVTLAAAFILVGLLCFLGYAAQAVNPNMRTDAFDTDTAQAAVFLVGLGAMASGSGLWHLAQRLAAARARTVMRRDPRQPVLYLRSFGDDRLRLRVATYGRAAFLERLTPRRLAPFEQVVERYLAHVGPVIAVNRPGTRLAPLGAARETLSDAEWRGAIDELIERSSWIVVCAAPQTVPPGFEWELTRLAARRWRRTLFVLPPVTDPEMRQRWEGFAAVLGRAAASMSTPIQALPVDPPDALASMLQPDGSWIAITSDRRDEWSYAYALQAATATMDPENGPTGRDGAD
jgi:hypothetical protein